jgi:2-polyprenyl-3-methyl-5-hydroxy-6-metoxy-1,4-benzoquinol methylase
MSCNCGLNEIFTDDVSRRDARKYRRRGLDVRARRMLRALEKHIDLQGRTSLEVGIGTGGFTVELLRRGVAAATGVDAIDNQLAQARVLANEAGVGERLQLTQGDFTEVAADLPIVDVVVLDRVVCCYPDWRMLLERAAAQTRSVMVLSYPRATWYNRIWIALANLAMRVLRRAFRMHLHPPVAMQALLRSRGFQPRVIGHRLAWELLVATRP